MSEGKSTGIDWKQLYALQNVSVQAGYGAGTRDDGTSPGNFVSVQGGGNLNEVIKFI